MSTSPDTQKGGNFSKQSPGSPLSDRPVARPGLILLKGIVWVALIVGAIVGLVMNFEIVWNVLVETVPLAFEVVEESVDTFFEAVVGLTPGFAQIATAYTGLVVFLAVFYLAFRKGISIYRKTQEKKRALVETYSNAWSQWSNGLKTFFLNWWNSLDLMNKVVASIFGVLIGIPLALLISYLLGSLVASFI